MGSLPESPGVSITRRMPYIQTHAYQLGKDGPPSESPPQEQSRATRTPALDLAQQAQLAACNYLGYNPRDLPNPVRQHQGGSSDTSRPWQLHMHNFHHHYLGSPIAGKLSQNGSQLKNSSSIGSPTSMVTNQLAITSSSILPRKSRAITDTGGNFATGLDSRSVDSAGWPFPREHSPSLPLLHGRVSDRDAIQTPVVQNSLRLRNESSDDAEHFSKYSQRQDERLNLKAANGREGTGMDVGSLGCGLPSRIANDCELEPSHGRLSGCPKPLKCSRPMSCLSLPWSQDDHGKRDSSSDLDNPFGQPSKSRKPNSSALALTNCKKARTFPQCRSSCTTPSEKFVSDDCNSSTAQVKSNSKNEQRDRMPVASAERIA